MRKSEALKWGGGGASLARKMTRAGFTISKQAIAQWPDEIPELRAYQIREIQAREAERKKGAA